MGCAIRLDGFNMPKQLSLSRPGFQQILGYQRSWLQGDMLAGITVAAYLVPQCMAYGELVGVPPVVGLWAIVIAQLGVDKMGEIARVE
jgi:sulfate permease, SulP family